MDGSLRRDRLPGRAVVHAQVGCSSGRGHGPQDERVAAPLVGGNAEVAVRALDQGHRGGQHPVEVPPARRQRGELCDHAQVEAVPFPFERVETVPREGERLGTASIVPPSGGSCDASTHAVGGLGRVTICGHRFAPRRVVARVGRLRRGEEPLEVAQPVAAVTTRIDPVVAKPALVAPGPDRVRVDAQQPGGLRHGQGGVGRAGL